MALCPRCPLLLAETTGERVKKVAGAESVGREHSTVPRSKSWVPCCPKMMLAQHVTAINSLFLKSAH